MGYKRKRIKLLENLPGKSEIFIFSDGQEINMKENKLKFVY
ncbi:MAG: hypothetical protein ABF652_12250 [Clostridium beijerinckii]